MDFRSECSSRSDSIAKIYVRAKCFTARLLRLYFGFGRRSFEPREEATKAGIAFSTTPQVQDQFKLIFRTMRFTAEISCFETAYDAENGKQRLLQRHFEADEASETVVVAAIRGKLVSSLSV